MSIIHEALKRQERDAANLPQPALLATTDPRLVIPPLSAIAGPAILGAGGVIVAAMLTYLATRPPQITVIVPPDRQLLAARATPASLDYLPLLSGNSALLTNSGAEPTLHFDEQPASTYAQTPSMERPSAEIPPSDFVEIPVPAVGPVVPMSPASGRNERLPETVAPGARGNSGSNDVPAGLLTIALSEGRIEAITGEVQVNDRPADRGKPILVGSRIITGADGSAALAFQHANMQLVAGTNARIGKLERRTTAAGATTEEVNVHLDAGAVRSVVPPGQGSVEVKTDAVSAVSRNGTFMVIKDASGAITVSGEEGDVRVTAKSDPGKPITVRSGETIRYDNGQWRAATPASEAPVEEEIAVAGGKKAGFRINLIPE